MMTKKYSLIIPVRNGMPYLPYCVQSIISQKYQDYELIISDDHSTDGTKEYLKTLNHPNIKIIYPQESMSMSEHWEWALTYSNGDWIMFVGQDDGVQLYFFELADQLIDIANKKNVRAIMSERAFFFWPGCDELYGNRILLYRAVDKIHFINSFQQALLALLGIQDYFELPTMYTTSLFKKTLVEEAKTKQGGKLFLTHPQDANLAAIAVRLERQYLKSDIPLGWVGSSPKSAGMAVTLSFEKKEKIIEQVQEDYLKKITKSSLEYHPLAGNFSIASLSLYFYGAMLKTQPLKKIWLDKIILSKTFRCFLLGFSLAQIIFSKLLKNTNRMNLFKELLKAHQISFNFIKILAYPCFFIQKLLYCFCFLKRLCKHLMYRSYYYRMVGKKEKNFVITHLMGASAFIYEKARYKRIINNR